MTSQGNYTRNGNLPISNDRIYVNIVKIIEALKQPTLDKITNAKRA